MAYKAHNWTVAERAFAEAYRIAPQRTQALYYFAASAARLGETDKALDALDRVADVGAGVSLDPDHAFETMAASARLGLIRAKFMRNAAPHCPCRTIFTGAETPFIAEGIAYEGMSGRLFISGVQSRRIIVIRDGQEQNFAELPDGLSPLGMRIDVVAGRLWVAAASMTQSDGATPSQQGHSALLAFDIASGVLTSRYDAPPVVGGRTTARAT